MGPFKLMDLTGIDIGYLTKKDRFAESGDPKDQPSKVSRHWWNVANSAGSPAAVGTTTTRPAPRPRDRQNR